MNYLDLIDQYKEEMIHTLQELISIRSVAGPAEGDAPFGMGVQKAFEYMLKKGKEEGFEVENVDNYGGHIDFGGYLLDENGEMIGTSEEIMGILGHLDVVPEGKDWDRDPYGGELEEGRIYGRGAIDDKGPVVAAFYAMKALKDAGVIPEKKVRLIMGLDEETGWKGMDYYLKKVKSPDFGFTPDGEFPAIHGEMGILIFELAKKLAKSPANAKGVVIRTITGGNAANMVADHARAVIRSDSYEEIKAKLSEFKQETGYKINAKGIGKSLEITTQGVSSHGARPEFGLNAISVLIKFLSQIKIENEDMQDFIDFYNKHIGFDLCGDLLGCGLSDEPSGKLILNVGMINVDDEAARLTINIRYPVTMNDAQVYEAMLPIVNEYNLGIIKLKHQEPIYLPEDDKMVCSLMDVYRKHSGDIDCKPMVIGGGTYARAVKNTVAFGASFPGDPELAHQKNEYISVENLVKCAKIFADAIFELAEGQYKKVETDRVIEEN
ncbi:dipeptidase PepV [Sinanaerobacter chloroacetimidivorans]|uniref:Dipeptidase PepV n=1 Tax=Sinanaerobacter chloroacetimidivorans TaxID=2818044 RepID=A0A8J7VZK1_9FIRM|nr:dipeptidase PepV [Sinanaerobacter chloroacetimidivorans]MBR0598052.1 dipeptidase PepV [Sinanaerobacter chloroacetimidivorans]